MTDEPTDEDEESTFESIDFGPREFQGTKAYADFADALDTEDDAQLRAALLASFVENEHDIPISDWIKHSEMFFHYIKSGRIGTAELKVHRGGANKTIEDSSQP